MKTLIDHVVILSFGQDGEPIADGCIAIENDRIVYAGPRLGLKKDFEEDVTIEGQGKLALPGFINAHTHAAMTGLRGVGGDMDLFQWLHEKIFPAEDKLDAEDVYWLSLLGIAEMIRNGVTAFADMYFYEDQVAQAVSDTGIRASLSRAIISGPGEEDRFQEAQALFSEWHEGADGRIRTMMSGHAVYTCNEMTLMRICNMAKEMDVMVHIHISETKKEVTDCIQAHKKTPVRYLNDIGFFDVPVLAAHCVHVDESDMYHLAEHNVKVAHNPVSNLKLGSGVAPVPRMLQRGMCVALGTDGASSNNNLSILKELQEAALIHKGAAMNSTLVTAAEACRMATRMGAEALGWDDEIGTLEKGKKADLILLDTTAPHWIPRQEAYAGIAYAAQEGDIDTVIVNGNVLMENRELVAIDMEEIGAKVQEIHDRIVY
jgi:5-methylthioadenosine/S-adenosylhomocysteine deaminase